jgi:hypothetical protein
MPGRWRGCRSLGRSRPFTRPRARSNSPRRGISRRPHGRHSVSGMIGPGDVATPTPGRARAREEEGDGRRVRAKESSPASVSPSPSPEAARTHPGVEAVRAAAAAPTIPKRRRREPGTSPDASLPIPYLGHRPRPHPLRVRMSALPRPSCSTDPFPSYFSNPARAEDRNLRAFTRTCVHSSSYPMLHRD